MGAPDFLRNANMAVRNCSLVGSIAFVLDVVRVSEVGVAAQPCRKKLMNKMVRRDRFCMRTHYIFCNKNPAIIFNANTCFARRLRLLCYLILYRSFIV